jgi:hypothetical protein
MRRTSLGSGRSCRTRDSRSALFPYTGDSGQYRCSVYTVESLGSLSYNSRQGLEREVAIRILCAREGNDSLFIPITYGPGICFVDSH